MKAQFTNVFNGLHPNYSVHSESMKYIVIKSYQINP